MVAISSVTSGANSIQTLVDQFMVPERRPITDLESSKTNLDRRVAVYTDLKSKLSALQKISGSLSGVGTLNTLSKKSAISSNTSFLTVSASASALVGSYAVNIDRLASNDTGISRQLDLSGTFLAGESLGLQEFTISVGSDDPITISVNVEATDTDEDVMNKVLDAINESDLEGVSASVIHDTSTTARLVIKGSKTGSENTLDLNEINGSNILRKLKYLTVGGNRRQTTGTNGGFLQQNTADLDALLNVDGVDIVKGTNEISDIIDGVTFKLLRAQEIDDSPLTITVTNDTTSAKAGIDTFIEKYNAAITYLNEKTKVDTTNFTRGDFTGDAVFTGLKFSLRSLISNSVTGLPSGEFQLLSQIGLDVSREGTISIKDSEKLNEALTTKTDQVTNLFSSENGVAKQLDTLLDRFVDRGGAVDRGQDSIKRQLTSIDSRIKNYEARLLVQEASLRRKFTELQKTLNLLNSQQSAISSFFTSSFGGNSGSFFSFFLIRITRSDILQSHITVLSRMKTKFTLLYYPQK